MVAYTRRHSTCMLVCVGDIGGCQVPGKKIKKQGVEGGKLNSEAKCATLGERAHARARAEDHVCHL